MTTSSGPAASLFAALAPSPLDPVLVSIEAFAADPRPEKINLGVGMYYDDEGRIPLMKAVHEAETILVKQQTPWGYIPVEGMPTYRKGVEHLLYGAESTALHEGRVATLQAISGTGALKVGAELLHLISPNAKVAVSDPSWVNHPALFRSAGFDIVFYPYVDATTGGLDFKGFVAALEAMAPGTIVVLQSCCHNPTGVDPTPAQWVRLAEVLHERQLIPFIDLAYQGFGASVAEDAYPVRLLAESGLPLLVALSFSKCFALYGERVGALSVVTASPGEAARLMGAAKNIIRSIYSTPPTHGAALVSTVLASPDLHRLWLDELDAMRRRIVSMRHALVDRLKGDNSIPDFSFMLDQRGLFSFSGLSPQQIGQLKSEQAVHAVENGRLCMAALNPGNVDRVAEAIRTVCRHAAHA